jgi:hypothetical protein
MMTSFMIKTQRTPDVGTFGTPAVPFCFVLLVGESGGHPREQRRHVSEMREREAWRAMRAAWRSEECAGVFVQDSDVTRRRWRPANDGRSDPATYTFEANELRGGPARPSLAEARRRTSGSGGIQAASADPGGDWPVDDRVVGILGAWTR